MKAHELYGVSRPSIDRWLKRYDGSKASLKYYSRKPKSHPNQSTPKEVKLIVDLRHKNKEYHGATIPGQKLQMDVKYVPTESVPEWLKKQGKKYYQYTIVDEDTSLRYLYWYDSKDSSTTVDFVKRAIKYFPFEIKMIQTDNGSEFTNRFANTKALSLLDKYLQIKGIEHKLIRPATPWHNGRVERSHRTDDKFFYSRLSFYSLEDLREQGKVWLRKYQNIYQRKYNYLSPVEVWKEYKQTGKHPIYDDKANSSECK